MAAYSYGQYSLNLETGEIQNAGDTAATIQYVNDYATAHFTDRSYITAGSIQNELQVTKLKIKQIDSLEERLMNIEKKVFGDYQAQKIQNKLDGSLDFENDVALFFQHDLNRKEWQKIFKEMKIDVDARELVRISDKYNAPKIKEA